MDEENQEVPNICENCAPIISKIFDRKGRELILSGYAFAGNEAEISTDEMYNLTDLAWGFFYNYNSYLNHPFVRVMSPEEYGEKECIALEGYIGHGDPFEIIGIYVEPDSEHAHCVDSYVWVIKQGRHSMVVQIEDLFPEQEGVGNRVNFLYLPDVEALTGAPLLEKVLYATPEKERYVGICDVSSHENGQSTQESFVYWKLQEGIVTDLYFNMQDIEAVHTSAIGNRYFSAEMLLYTYMASKNGTYPKFIYNKMARGLLTSLSQESDSERILLWENIWNVLVNYLEHFRVDEYKEDIGKLIRFLLEMEAYYDSSYLCLYQRPESRRHRKLSLPEVMQSQLFRIEAEQMIYRKCRGRENLPNCFSNQN